MKQPWHPDSWQTKPCQQAVLYPDTNALHKVIEQLTAQPPLVTVQQILALKNQLAKAALGQQFLLQGGDCAESFARCDHGATDRQLAVLLHLCEQLEQTLSKPVICVGRMAGQYAKPRTKDTETKNSMTLPSYRGDLINQPDFTLSARTPDPHHMLKGYDCAAQVMARIPHNIYTSHEALLLWYEQALTRSGYNLATHFPWCGIRTTQPDGAHIEYLRGIANPIALKIGVDTNPDILIRLLNILNPHNEPGRITLIHRFGANAITQSLPPLIQAVKAHNKIVLWSCDPMHGNTHVTENSVKMRWMQPMIDELQQAFRIHQSEGSYLGGIHLELTGDDVTECLDVPACTKITEMANKCHTTLVDPRLNHQQALQIIQLVEP
jgi:3-deoxy-7-phosphoheptulonate synthase